MNPAEQTNSGDCTGSVPTGSVSGKLLVAAIDFGTTYSGYAFSFRHEYEQDPLKISNNISWQSAGGGGLVSWKTPTTVLLRPDKSYHSFGFDAEDHYTDLADREEHKDWYYFKRFKMKLHNRLDLKRDIEIPDATEKMMPARTIFAHAIRFLKNHLLNMIRSRGIDFYDDDIMWVLTIPAIWNEPAKQFMREAAVEAGINNNHLKLALEPEAASVYCKCIPLERRLDDEQGVTLGPFSPDTRYLVLDLGGGTVDVTVHQVKKDGTLKELHKASGGAWGGTRVDATYFDLFKRVLGEDVMDRFKREDKYEHLDMERDFELKKRTLRDDIEKVNINISVALVELAEEMTGKKLADLIKEAGMEDKMVFRRGRATFKSKVIEEMFAPSIKSIIDHVRSIIDNSKVGQVHKILMVGGFSESQLVRQAVKAAFPDVYVVAPAEPGLAVVKGAVIFGHAPDSISTRVSRYTYGVAAQGDFVEGVHPEGSKVIYGENVYCRDLFSKLIGIGEDIDASVKIEREYDVADKNASMRLEIFASECEYPIHVRQAGCVKIGQLVINAPLGGWRSNAQLKIAVGFGGTEMTVTATEVKTQIEQEATFDFLS